MQNLIVNLRDMLEAGALFRPPDDKLRVEAFIPALGRQSHAAYSYRRRQCIKYVRFTEDWIREQLDWLCPAEG
jgi:hypothetical protein